MTLVLAVIGKRSLWLVTDRRLSNGRKVVKDDAIKSMTLQTTDGRAILGYAGLGATARGTEPSGWMSRVLQGRNLPLEQSLGVLAKAMHEKFYGHLGTLQRGNLVAHHVVIPAFVGDVPRMYTIDLALTPDRKQAFFRYTRHEWTYPTGAVRTPKVAYTGSGTSELQKNSDWSRWIRRVLKAHERGRLSSLAVADALAEINHNVHLREASVGPNCVVTWSYGNGMTKFNGGSQSYSGRSRDPNTPPAPAIAVGFNLGELARRFFANMASFDDESDDAGAVSRATRAAWENIPTEPDDNLV